MAVLILIILKIRMDIVIIDFSYFSFSHEINQIVVIIAEYLSRNYFILRATIIPGSGYVPETALKTER